MSLVTKVAVGHKITDIDIENELEDTCRRCRMLPKEMRCVGCPIYVIDRPSHGSATCIYRDRGKMMLEKIRACFQTLEVPRLHG